MDIRGDHGACAGLERVLDHLVLDVGLPSVAEHVGLDVVRVAQVGQTRLILHNSVVHRLAEVARVAEVHHSHSLPVFSEASAVIINQNLLLFTSGDC